MTLLSGLLFLIFILGALGHLWRLIWALLGKKKSSGLLLIPGIFGMMALWIAPIQSDLFRWHSYWWIPPFADVGCVPWLIYYVCLKIKQPRKSD